MDQDGQRPSESRVQSSHSNDHEHLMKHTSYKISSGIIGKFCSLPFDLALFWFFICGGESIVEVALAIGPSRLSDNALRFRTSFSDVL
jgi:hypothetical protein